MNVNINAVTYATSKKLDIPKQPNKKEEFKKILDNHELQSRNSANGSVDKKCNKHEELDKANTQNQDDDVEKTTVEGNTPKDSCSAEDNIKLKAKIISFIETAIDALKQNAEKPSKELESADKSAEEMAQIQQLLQFLGSMFQSVDETSDTKSLESGLKSINLEQLLGGEKLMPDAKNILRNNLSEIAALLEKSKGNNEMHFQISEMLQKLTTGIEDVKGDLSLLKVPSFEVVSRNVEDKLIKGNELKNPIEKDTKTASGIIPQNQMQGSNDVSRDSKSSGNSSFEEKFLKNLLGEDKDDMKISKTVNFMNQFEAVKTLDTSKVQTPNLVINKSDFQADVIKNIKFMEINNIKDLTVKMNPKELGEITIKITMESGIMKANISAQNKETYNLLNQNIQDISDKLKNMDIKIQSLDINIYEDSTFFSKDSNEKNNNGRQDNNRGTNRGLEEEDIITSSNYAIEENQVNKFV
jgi:flagellar hook-length control protein FliK